MNSILELQAKLQLASQQGFARETRTQFLKKNKINKEVERLRTLQQIYNTSSSSLLPQQEQFLVSYFSENRLIRGLLQSTSLGEVREFSRSLIPHIQITYPRGGYFNQQIAREQALLPTNYLPGVMISFQLVIQKQVLLQKLAEIKHKAAGIRSLLSIHFDSQLEFNYELRGDLTTFFGQGDPFNGVFVVYEGVVNCLKNDVRILQLTRGSLFGELEARGHRKRNYTAKAESVVCLVIWIKPNEVAKLLNKNFSLFRDNSIKQQSLSVLADLAQRRVKALRQKKSVIYQQIQNKILQQRTVLPFPISKHSKSKSSQLIYPIKKINKPQRQPVKLHFSRNTSSGQTQQKRLLAILRGKPSSLDSSFAVKQKKLCQIRRRGGSLRLPPLK